MYLIRVWETGVRDHQTGYSLYLDENDENDAQSFVSVDLPDSGLGNITNAELRVDSGDLLLHNY